MQCEMSNECTEPVTYIGAKGYIYCTKHGQFRKSQERTRRMQSWELHWINQGRPLPSYEAGPEPKREA